MSVHLSSGWSRCSPDGSCSNFSKCSGRNGSEMTFSPLNHFPRSTSLHRFEQNGPYGVANQSPAFLHIGHLTIRGVLMSHIQDHFARRDDQLVYGSISYSRERVFPERAKHPPVSD